MAKYTEHYHKYALKICYEWKNQGREIVTYKVLSPPNVKIAKMNIGFDKILTLPPFLINVLKFTVFFLTFSIISDELPEKAKQRNMSQIF